MNTGLGWECPAVYLVYNAGTVLGKINGSDETGWQRIYEKYNNGFAAAVFVANDTGNKWRGPFIISTDPDAVVCQQTGSEYHGSVYGATGTIRHYRKTWYYNVGMWLPDANYATGLPVANAEYDGNSMPSSIPVEILDSMWIRPYVSPEVRAFLAGMAAGLATKHRGYGI